ncbi:type II toxin-antitoxin system YhaV family toxin [Azotobacter beijerinckii]|uniref:type II toxin-antitoxin system YhaV family toxin n=1 Tax=Azotobacter beijerinckii TaxID=170623 RepID=UPI002952D37E|nr:type II toxin-antitoxin system YhaV family toxin [Azotobacter beijerinckii]MDV7209900.1 type II toxin-antitoxin system YhaV family toxin [Azotobacter beijerinckii]
MHSGTVTVVNDWALFGHPLFLQRLEELIEEVEGLAEDDPDGFHHHAHYKLLDKVGEAILVRAPTNPAAPEYFQGKTLGKENGHWRRIKNGLPNRYRLFFQFRSDAPKSIIYAWLNDEATLRKDGSKTDVYAVFLAKVKRGEIPSSFADLERAAGPIPGHLG